MSSRRAFTLTEVLVVIVIIALTAGLVFPVFGQAKRAARGTVDISNMRQLFVGLVLYEQDDDDSSPYSLGLLRPLVGSAEVFGSDLDKFRKPFDDGTWPGKLFISCSKSRSPFKISYGYLKTYPPFDEDVDLWQALRKDSRKGILASPWLGTPVQTPDSAFPCGDRLVTTYGPRMDGPILRINMDGSFFRLGQNAKKFTIGSTSDLFYTR